MKKSIYEIHERIKHLREDVLNINQSAMSSRINIKQGTLSDIERKRTKNVTDRVINDICREFNVNEEWLRTGKGEKIISQSSISLDEYAKRNDLSELECDIIKAYMDIDKDIRKDLLSTFNNIFNKHSEVSISSVAEEAPTYSDDGIDAEVESYRRELEAEKKGEILKASQSGENIG